MDLDKVLGQKIPGTTRLTDSFHAAWVRRRGMNNCFENSQNRRFAIWDAEHTDFTEHADVYLCAPCVPCDLRPIVTAEHFHATWVRRRGMNNCSENSTFN
jgi:hypothetical protein